MSDSPCNFMWYELMTTDVEAAKAFYTAVVGWGTMDAEVPGVDYTLFTVRPKAGGVAGVMQMPEGMCESGGRPGWGGYIAVDDADAYAAKIQEKGGTIYRAPDDIPEVGRFAVVADPHGAVFMIITPAGEAPADMPPLDMPGMAGWRELHAGNGEEAFEFYSSLFGWTKDRAVDMGDMGVYQTFAAGGDAIGGMMTKMPDCPGGPFWVYYFNVDEINAAAKRVTDNGGQVIMGPHEVPGGSWILQGMDPQGAMFALVAPGS